MTEKKRGRPKGSIKGPEERKRQGHYMSPKAHKWIQEHKRQIEHMAHYGIPIK